MSFGLYAIGFAIMIGGLMYGAHRMHMPTHWIAVEQSYFWAWGFCRESRRRVRETLRNKGIETWLTQALIPTQTLRFENLWNCPQSPPLLSPPDTFLAPKFRAAD
jgi:hypothetical protein